MSYKVQGDFTPVYELAISLKLYIDKKMIKNADLGIDWYKRVSTVLDEEFKEYIVGFNEEACCFSYLFLLIWLSPKKENVNEFLIWLKQLTPGEMYEKLSPIVDEALPNDLGKLRDVYVSLLSKWQNQYFTDIDPLIVETLQKNAQSITKAKITDSIEFVEKVSGGIRIPSFESLEKIILIPSYHQSPFITYHRHQSIFLVFYSVDLPNDDSFAPSKALLRLAKAVSDENRLKILKKLTEGPKNFSSLLTGLEVSKSTVHHHIMALRSAGLISVLVSEDCGHDEYILRSAGVDELAGYLKKYLSL